MKIKSVTRRDAPNTKVYTIMNSGNFATKVGGGSSTTHIVNHNCAFLDELS